jgi:CHAT domain-containing protein
LCGLALAGANRGVDSLGHLSGVVTAEEIAGLDLSSCELAVLSACDTDVGIARAGQGVRSLQAALHAAGAGTAITSLWKVDDQSTRQLFEDFYTRIWVKKEPKAQALWKAKSALRKKGAPTREWAAWVLSGDPN